jgi:TPP-dependent trihydroxycyclohexane-1,2-dione (THcHDO) dehydratase
MAANQLAPQADLVIGIGTRLTDFTTGSKALFSHPDVEFLLLNVAEFDALKLDATALIADAQTGLTGPRALDYRSGWGEAIAQAKSPGATSAAACGIASGVLTTRPKWRGTWMRSWRNTARRSTPA